MKKKCYLYNFPTLEGNSWVREPSVLYLVPNKKDWDSEFVFDNAIKKNGDLYLCSVFTCGYPDFQKFSKKVGREKIIAGGYHPSLCPKDFLRYASKVVVGYGDNAEVIYLLHKYRINIHLTIFAEIKTDKKEAEAYFAEILKILHQYRPTSVEMLLLRDFLRTRSTGITLDISREKAYLTDIAGEKYVADELSDGCSSSYDKWYIKSMTEMQLKYYLSKEYSGMRNFNCGDNLSLQFLNAQKGLKSAGGARQGKSAVPAARPGR